MKTKNCPNCGAPYDPALIKCPYCGTAYIDMSMIDLVNHEPIYIAIRVPGGKSDYILRQKVVPINATLNFNSETVDVCGPRNERLMSYTKSVCLDTDLSFVAIPDENNAICAIVEK